MKDGKIREEVDTIRLAIGARRSAPNARLSGVWKFLTRSRQTDFFITVSSVQGDMKGSVHRTRAHFGFSEPLITAPESWVGPLPHDRHYQVLLIPELAPGEHFRVFRVSFPGFALAAPPQPVDAKKRTLIVEPPALDHEISFGLTVVEGDWAELAIGGDGDEYVGLLTGDSDRYALISVMRRAYPDVAAAIKNMNRNLGLINTGGRSIPDTDLSALLWMERESDQPLKIIELNGIRKRPM